MRTRIAGYFADWSWFERLWLLTFTVVNVYLFFALDDTFIGLCASLTGMLSVVLVAKGKTWNYYPGMINVVLYAIVAYGQKYYGEVMLNLLYFLPMQFIGLLLWRRNKVSEEKQHDVRVAVMTNRTRLYWAMTCLAATAAYAWVLQAMGGALPLIDSLTAVLSIVAMIFMVKRVVEQWIVWIIIDVLTIYMWLVAFMGDGSDVSILVMWIAYLVNAVYGWLNWRSQYLLQKEGQAWAR